MSTVLMLKMNWPNSEKAASVMIVQGFKYLEGSALPRDHFAASSRFTKDRRAVFTALSSSYAPSKQTNVTFSY